MPELPITKRFPGKPCMRSTVWMPHRDDPGKPGYSFRMGFEGSVSLPVADLIVALQVNASKISPEMETQIKAMTAELMKKD